MCAIVDIVNNFVKTSQIPVYAQRQHTGVWRQIAVRVSERFGTAMLVIQHAPLDNHNGNKFGHLWESERKRLVDLLTSGDIDISAVEARRVAERKGVEEAVEKDVEKVRQDKKQKLERGHQGELENPPGTTTSATIAIAHQQVTQSDIEPSNPKTIKVASIFFQEFDGKSCPPPEHPTQHAFGETYLEERLGKCTFRVSRPSERSE